MLELNSIMYNYSRRLGSMQRNLLARFNTADDRGNLIYSSIAGRSTRARKLLPEGSC